MGRRLVALAACLCCLSLAGVGWSAPPRAGGALGAAAPSSPDADAEATVLRQAELLEMSRAELDALRGACHEAGFTLQEVTRLLALVARAKLSGLPHVDLLNKWREGLAKGAMPEVVQKAMEEKARTLRKAKELVDTLILQGWAAPDHGFAVALVADALEAGAGGADVLRAVRSDRPIPDGCPDVRAAFRAVGAKR